MKHLILLACFLAAKSVRAQCPTIPLQSLSHCSGTTLEAVTSDRLTEIKWYNGSTIIKSQTANTASATGTTVAGGNGRGNAANQFYAPNGIFLDAAGNLYVADNINYRIQKFAPGSTTGVTVAGNGAGANPDQFNTISDIFFTADGTMYVADILNARIQKWLPGATAGITVAGGNGQGTAANQFFLPAAVWVDKDNNIFVVDELNYRVQKWPPGATTGITVAGGNGKGSAANQFDNPVGLWMDDAGIMYVADAGNNRIQMWAPGAGNAVTVAGGNGFGPAANQFANPIDVLVDEAGNIYVVDNNNQRIQRWAPGATSGETVAGGNGAGGAANQFYFPYAIALDGDGLLYVSDVENDRVQRWIVTTDLEKKYTALNPGSYTAELTFPDGCTVTTNQIVIYPTLLPAITVTASQMQVCIGEPITFTAAVTNEGNNPVFHWKKNSKDVGTNSPVYTDNEPAQGDVVMCILTSDVQCPAGNPVGSNPVSVRVNPKPVISLDQSPDLCRGEVRELDAGIHESYLWNDGSTDKTLLVDAPGTYSVTVKDNFGCMAGSATTITDLRSQPAGFLPLDTSICSYSTFLLKPTGTFNQYIWSTGSTGSQAAITKPGVYSLTVTDRFNCTGSDTIIIVAADCPKGLFVPTAFTPNLDGRNDQFRAVAGGTVKSFSLIVYNRWGNEVFKSYNPAKGWNGSLNGKPLDSGIYIWTCNYQLEGEASKLEKGTVMLIR